MFSLGYVSLSKGQKVTEGIAPLGDHAPQGLKIGKHKWRGFRGSEIKKRKSTILIKQLV